MCLCVCVWRQRGSRNPPLTPFLISSVRARPFCFVSSTFPPLFQNLVHIQKRFEDYGGPYGQGDTIGCALDADAGVLSFTKNGADLGAAFELPKHVKGQV